MIQESAKLVLILMDCTGGKYQAERNQYGVKGYPTILFLDPDGKEVGKLGDRSPDAVIKQFAELADQHGRAGAWLEWDKAVEKGKEEKKPVVLLFATAKPDSEALETAIGDDSLKDLREKFVFGKSDVKSDVAKKFKVHGSTQPVLLVVDPSLEKPEEKLVKKWTGKKTAKELKKDLEAALKKFDEGK